MAEFALGLTKTAVEGTVSSVKSAIDEEEEFKDRVRNDLVFITGEFQMMQSFLNDANKERAKNEVARTWVRQIRDLAFHVEDCVELVVNLDIKSDWSWLWRVLPDCMQPPLPLDDAVTMIQRLKARVEDVSHRKTRYNLIGDSGSSSNSSKHALVTTISSAAPELMLPASADVGASSTTFQTLREVWEATGKMRPDMGDLKKLITNEGPHLEVISLWPNPGSAADLGLGLLGAINIIRETYNDPEICKKFKSRAWVKLMNPFNPDEFLKNLLTQFYANSHIQENVVEVQFQKKMKAAVAIEDEFMQQWSQQSCLVIVEQLSTMVEWDAIKFYLRNSGKGSRIVVATQQLGLALCCTGKPYQVSELGQFYDGQSLCVFFKKVSGRHSDMGELISQLTHGGVISLWDKISGKSALVNKVFNCITQKSKEWDGPKFDRHSWIDVPAPFDMGVFSRHLFLNFHSNDLRAQEIAEVSKMGEEAIIHRCRKILREDNCLIVINGLKSTGEWDLIKTTFLLVPTKSCILVLGKDACVATYCVDKEERAFKIEDLEADSVLRHKIKACEYIGIGGKEASSRGRFFSNRREEACDWMNKFKHGVPENEVYNDLLECLYSDPGVICLCGTTGAGKSALARRIYYNQMLIVREDVQEFRFYLEESFDFGFTKYSWIDVPHPFNLTDLCWRLLLDFHSDDLHDKDTVALSMMNGRQDPIEGCLKFLRQDKCFIVIDGLRSTDDWDLIKVYLLSEPTKGCILVITNEASVATHCVDQKGRVINVKGPEADVARHPLIKNKWSLHQRSRVFSSRMVQARDWITKFELIGHGSEWVHLNNNLRKSSPSVIAVWGIAGVGKTALVGSFYYKNLIGLRQFFTYIDCGFLDQVTKYSWVDVPHPFNLRDLSRRLLLDFHSDDLEAKETEARGMMEGLDPIQACRKFMRQNKCFVVIDGLRSTDDWDFIKTAFLSEPIKGCILVITNDKTVATHCVDEEGQVINVKGLEANTALNLFTKVASGGKQLSPKEIEVSKLTMTKCGGLPKVIAAIGEQYIASQRGIPFLENLNSNFMGTLENMPEFHSLGGLFSWMESYFDACPDALKPCIFYLSVFPADYGIRRRRLLRRWIAEGYSRDKFGISAEKDGENLFYELVKLSIIQISGEYMNRLNEPNSKVDKKKENVFQVNSFIHGYIISRQLEDNLVFALEGHCKLNSQRAGQHLTIRSSWDRDKIVFESTDLSRLRSLTVFGEWKSFFISTADSSNMSLLRVLDLEDTTSGVTDGVLEQIGKLLPRLKFLSVRGCKDITCLPDSLGGLRQLQTLDVRHTYIVKLPLAIMKLHKLQYISAGTTHEPLDQGHDTQPPAPADHDGTSTSQTAAAVAANGEATSTSQTAAAVAANGKVASTSQPAAETPPVAVDGRTSTTLAWRRKARNLVESYSCSWSSKKKEQRRRQGLNGGGVEVPVAGIGNLTALHTLGVVRVSGAAGKDILKEVKKLTQLHKLRVSGINQKNWHDLCSAISGHNHLESLSVRLDEDEQQDHLCCLSEISSPPKTLKSLKLYGGNVHVSVVWMKQLGDNLIKADFQDLELIMSTQEDIDSLIELPFKNMFRHLCLKPIQDGELHYDRLEAPWPRPREAFDAPVLRIDCSSYRLAIVFGGWIPTCVEVLVVHCSTDEASLEVSGLEKLFRLKEVWLKGSYSDAIKQHLQQKVEEHEKKPVLKLDPQQPAPPTPCACLKRQPAPPTPCACLKR